MSETKNTKPERGEQPKYAWPRLGTDAPRVPWADFLRLWATEIDKQIGGKPGRFLGSWLLGLALQAEALGRRPRRARGLARRRRPGGGLDPGAEAEAAAPGRWTLTEDPDYDPEMT